MDHESLPPSQDEDLHCACSKLLQAIKGDEQLLQAINDSPNVHAAFQDWANCIPDQTSGSKRRPIHAVADNSVADSGSIKQRNDQVNFAKGCGFSDPCSTIENHPFSPAETNHSEPALPPSVAIINDCRKSALVIENHELLLKFLKQRMEQEGYAVRTACSFEQGLRLYEHSAPFVVLINHCLPDGGIELAKAIRQRNPLQGLVLLAFDYRNAEEVSRPKELKDVPVLTDICELRRAIAKVKCWATSDEVRQAFDMLNDADILKIKKFAEGRVYGLGRASAGWSGKDLLNQALLATFLGAEGAGNGRRWNKNIEFAQHLTGVIQSISSHMKSKYQERDTYRESELITYDAEGQASSPLDKIAAQAAAADACLIAKEKVACLVKAFEDDRVASLVIQALLRGMKKNEIISENALTSNQYEAAMKRIRLKLLGRKNGCGENNDGN